MADPDIRLSIVEATARTNPGMLTPEERRSVADSIDPDLPNGPRYEKRSGQQASASDRQTAQRREVLSRLMNGERPPTQRQPIGNATEWPELPGPLQAQLEHADALVTSHIRNGGDFDMADLGYIFDNVPPVVRERIVGMHAFYDNPAENRVPFLPKITGTDLARADGLDTEVFDKVKGAMDSAIITGGLKERMDKTDSDKGIKPVEYKPGLRDSIESAQMAHELFAQPDPIPDASDTFREMAPSVRASVEAVSAFLDEKGGD